MVSGKMAKISKPYFNLILMADSQHTREGQMHIDWSLRPPLRALSGAR